MGIVRRVEWRLRAGADDAARALWTAVESLGMHPEASGHTIRASSARSVRRNRWAAEITVEISPLDDGSRALVSVDMLGNKHFALIDEIAEAVGDAIFDDRGLTEAVERLGKAGRIFGRKEVRHLRHLLHATERVVALGQGVYEKQQGLIVLTSERLFFFEKSLGSETVEEFALKSISSLEVRKSLGGEQLVIHASGNTSEIKQMLHGQADELARQFRAMARGETSAAGPAAASAAPAAGDPMAQLERLADLHAKGVIDAEEFQAKKAELLRRI